MRLIDADALIDKYGDWYTEEGTEEGYIGTIKGIVDSMPTIEPQPMDVQEAYFKGKIDGIKECTARLRRLTAEFKNREMNGGDANV